MRRSLWICVLAFLLGSGLARENAPTADNFYRRVNPRGKRVPCFLRYRKVLTPFDYSHRVWELSIRGWGRSLREGQPEQQTKQSR
jgi:hypothetical protein